MTSVNLGPVMPVTRWSGETGKPEKIRDAAEQFEALLIGQLLRSARESGSEKGDAATEFAEQHMATCIARNGGLGLAGVIARSLEQSTK